MKNAASITARKNLNVEFRRIKSAHRNAQIRTVARTVLTPSVMRVFREGTREDLLPVMETLDVRGLRAVRSQEAFSEWFDKGVARIWRTIGRKNKDNHRIQPGGKWGHSTKIMTLFSRGLVLTSRVFPDSITDRLAPFLYVPIDGVIMRRLERLDVDLPFRRIREIDSRSKFYMVQDLLGETAHKIGVPRVWFDDNWGDRQ